MKAVIAIPPVLDFYFTPRRAAALGARVTAREFIDIGWDVGIVNLPLTGRPRHVPLPEDLSYLKDFIIPGETGPLSWFSGYRRFGPDFAESAEIIASENPDLVCLSSFAWGYAEEARDLAMAVARRLPDVPIVIGGHGPSSLPEYFLRLTHPVQRNRPLFALVVSGEIEGFMREFIESVFSENTGRLDLRGIPRKNELLPIAGESIRQSGRRSISAMFTRGCPKGCRFCSNHICHGRDFRVSPPESWIECVCKAAGDAAELHLNIEDDNILFLKKEFFNFLKDIKGKFPDISLTAENGLDYMLLEKSDVNRLKESGFSRLNLSLSVLSPGTGKKENREGDSDRLAGLIQRAAEIDLPVTTYVISGLAGDSVESIIETLAYLDPLPTQTGLLNFYPVPGLPGFLDPELFLSQSPRLALGSSVYPWTGALTTSQMITAFRLARWSNYRKSRKPGDSYDELQSKILRTGRLQTVVRDQQRLKIMSIPNLDNNMAEEFIKCR